MSGTHNPLRRLTVPDTFQKASRTTWVDDIQASEDEDSWPTRAACRGRTNEMFPRYHKDISYISTARAICRSCPVTEECLDYALQWPSTDMHGVWAGLTPRQLAAEQQRRQIVTIRPTVAQIWAEFDKIEKKQQAENERDTSN